MVEDNLPPQVEKKIDDSKLFDLMNRFQIEQKDYLNLCFQYLNFYIGIILTIMGLTIVGIVQTTPGETRNLIILCGPIVSVFLGILGYSNVKVFFRRFIEAWLTLRNIEEMFGDQEDKLLNSASRPPLFRSKFGGFITRFERKPVEEIIIDAQKKKLNAEEVIDRIAKMGDTLFYSRLTFILFICISIILFIAVILVNI